MAPRGMAIAVTFINKGFIVLVDRNYGLGAELKLQNPLANNAQNSI
jgi:hypothetical protein